MSSIQETKDMIEGAQALRDDYARRIREIDRDVEGMKRNLLRMIQTPIIEVR